MFYSLILGLHLTLTLFPLILDFDAQRLQTRLNDLTIDSRTNISCRISDSPKSRFIINSIPSIDIACAGGGGTKLVTPPLFALLPLFLAPIFSTSVTKSILFADDVVKWLLRNAGLR